MFGVDMGFTVFILHISGSNGPILISCVCLGLLNSLPEFRHELMKSMRECLVPIPGLVTDSPRSPHCIVYYFSLSFCSSCL